MKKVSLFMIAAAAVMLCACGPKTEEKSVSAEEDTLLIEQTVDEAVETAEEAVEEVANEVEEVKEAVQEAAPVQEVAKEEPKVDKKAAWDKWLDDYDAVVENYVKVYKKSQSQDLAALNELAEVSVKMERLQKNMPGEATEMTQDQLARFSKISTKMASGLK